jgi:hypothetical protein
MVSNRRINVSMQGSAFLNKATVIQYIEADSNTVWSFAPLLVVYI